MSSGTRIVVPPAAQPVGHPLAVERRDDRAGVARLEIGVEQRHAGLAGAHAEPARSPRHRERRAAHGGQAARAEGAQLLEEAGHSARALPTGRPGSSLARSDEGPM